MKTLMAILLCMLAFCANVTDTQEYKPPDHLLPLDGQVIGFLFWFQNSVKLVNPKKDYPISSIYVWRASKPSVKITIYQRSNEKSYYLLYVSATHPTPTLKEIRISAEFAKQISDTLFDIIKKGTRYP